jgi:hypothetical protein
MEVHHHPSVEKKNFKEYFLEFLMIFLAVTMGFFAENIREYMSDREKEHSDIHSLAKNLNADSVAIESSLQSIQWVKMKMDSLMDLLRSGKYKEQQLILYRLAYQTRGFQQFEYSNVTFEEMKSSGSLGLIRNETIRNDFVNYNNFITSAIRQLEGRMFETEKNQADWQSNILDDSFYPRVDSIIYQHMLNTNFYKPGNHALVISESQPVQFLKLYNLLFERDVIFNYYQLELQKLKNQNKQLLASVKKEYQLERE